MSTELKKAIDAALAANTEISREEYAAKMAEADKATEAHGFSGEAPLTEEERERRMRMNYYGTIINVGMSILAALDALDEKLVGLNQNLITLAKMHEGDNVNVNGRNDPGTGD